MLHVHMLTNPIVVALHASSDTMAFFVALIATLVLFALNTIAEELEEPFGMDANDLPMNHYLASFIQVRVRGTGNLSSSHQAFWSWHHQKARGRVSAVPR